MTGHERARRFDRALEPLADDGGPVRDWRIVHLPATNPPWTDIGLSVDAGDEVTWLASGRLVLMEALDLWYGPTMALWARIAGGPVFKGRRDTTTFTADKAGPIELAIYNGEWATPDGTLATPLENYQAGGGGIDVVLIRWRGSAADGLAALAAALPDEPLVAAERARLADAAATPPGWHYLWFLGDGEIYRPHVHDGKPCIGVHTRNDVGILQRPVSAPLTATTELSWSWNLERLPTDVAEDQAHVHDYMSIAVEFDNGLDLTYYWSAALPVGTHFRCPLPQWDKREFHWVLRSGAEGLGRWHGERRTILADYAAAIGGPPPSRIVAVWLIAVSLFRHGEGKGAFADIALIDGATRVPVP
jgi:hypothetical protein